MGMWGEVGMLHSVTLSAQQPVTASLSSCPLIHWTIHCCSC